MEICNGVDYLDQVKELIIEYTKRLERDLYFQNIDEELENLAKKYTAPEGELLVAVEKKKVIGMVAYHRHSKSRCEMKRLYVKPEYRENKLGKKLVLEILEYAKKAGYKEMVLDTIIPLQSAIHLYKKVGFVEREAYYHNLMDDVLYFKKIL